ncbi:hypothetical protein [Amycolatopsis sp. CA-128772]|nr:hypothetical protein [Amycolatopsis sp. CA-128772]
MTLPHVVAGLTGAGSDQSGFVRRYAGQLARLVEHLGAGTH